MKHYHEGEGKQQKHKAHISDLQTDVKNCPSRLVEKRSVMECELVTRLLLTVKSRTPAAPLHARNVLRHVQVFSLYISQDPFTSTGIANYLQVIVNH